MTILQALDGYYSRMDARGEVVAPGYSVQPVGVVVVLAPDGAPIRVERRWDSSGKRAQQMSVPKWFTRQGTGSTPFFLWDNTAYALGISEKDPVKTGRDHAAFRALHLEALATTEDEGLLALRRFVETWTPERFGDAPFDPKMVEQNVAFRLGDERGLIHERPAAAALVEVLRNAGERRAEVDCLVTGRRLPPVRLHPKIKGVDGTAAAEVPLVSFQQDAFKSYGNEQGANAPTSEAAAFRYGAALNRLLDREMRTNRIKVADATVAFWADASGTGEGAEAAAAAADGWFSAMVEPPTDAAEAAKVRGVLEKIRDGRPASALAPGVEANTRFHVLGLAPNAARLSIRFWLVDSFDAFAARLAAHHADLALTPPPLSWNTPPSVQRLLVRTTALMGKFENIPPLLAGEVMRAVLSGAPYPRTLLAAAVIRLRAGDGPGSGWHAAVIKACVNRPLRRTVEQLRHTVERLRREKGDPAAIRGIEDVIKGIEKDEMLPVGLNPEFPDPAYQLGRLFCVLESAQRAALGQVNASIADRYYGAASATPARVFGPLLRNLRVHVADARRRGFGGWIEPRVAEIMSHLPPELPRTLKLEDQGRFAVGYYHERGTRSKAREEEAALAAAEGAETVEGGNT